MGVRMALRRWMRHEACVAALGGAASRASGGIRLIVLCPGPGSSDMRRTLSMNFMPSMASMAPTRKGLPMAATDVMEDPVIAGRSLQAAVWDGHAAVWHAAWTVGCMDVADRWWIVDDSVTVREC